MARVLGICVDEGDITQLQLGKKFWLKLIKEGGEHYYVSHHHIQSESAYFAIARGCHFEIVEEEVQVVLEEMEYEQMSLF